MLREACLKLLSLLGGLKGRVIYALRTTEQGNWIYFLLRRGLGTRAVADYEFPNLISLELASACNLNCYHCPTHSREINAGKRKLGMMSWDLFCRAMDEIDQYGKRRIYLHKDGEPLLNPHLPEMLSRLKRWQDHYVYLSTNGTLLDGEAAQRIVEAGINHVNVSIGASSDDMYKRIRGGDIETVKANVMGLLSLAKSNNGKPRVSVQIIRLDQYEMEREIKEFARFWERQGVEVWVWDELTWGLKQPLKMPSYRYPCYSLWDSFNINSDGNVSACCMDWNQSLLIGNMEHSSIRSIWKGERLRSYRKDHVDNNYSRMNLCRQCNYWHWQPVMSRYRLG